MKVQYSVFAEYKRKEKKKKIKLNPEGRKFKITKIAEINKVQNRNGEI